MDTLYQCILRPTKIQSNFGIFQLNISYHILKTLNMSEVWGLNHCFWIYILILISWRYDYMYLLQICSIFFSAPLSLRYQGFTVPESLVLGVFFTFNSTLFSSVWKSWSILHFYPYSRPVLCSITEIWGQLLPAIHWHPLVPGEFPVWGQCTAHVLESQRSTDGRQSMCRTHDPIESN